MDYVEVDFKISPFYPWSELFIQDLADIEFESFLEDEGQIQAFIQKKLFKIEHLDDLISSYKEKEVSIAYETKDIPHQNWNALWEADYKPITIGKQLYIKAPFHEKDDSYDVTIEIQPQMSFGTGHHQTTYLLCQALLQTNVKNKKVIDIGTGTGILGILASKLGAKQIFGNDIDEFSVQNAIENCERNNVTNFEIKLGSIEVVPQGINHLILANINRNIILEQMKEYASRLITNGLLFLSGFYEADIIPILSAAETYHLEAINILTKDTWTVLVLKKTK